MSLAEDATHGGFLVNPPPPTMKKVFNPQAFLLDNAFMHYANSQALLNRWVTRQHQAYRLAEELTLLTVVAEFPWLMSLAWKMGYQGPWRMVEAIYRWEKDQ